MRFPELTTERMLTEAYELKQQKRTLKEIIKEMSNRYGMDDLVEALVIVATRFNWKRT